jgi:hypothetical protein
VGAWWASYTTTLPGDHQVPWAEFRNAFQAYHILKGLMNGKLQEFLDLKQGSGDVYDYWKKFNHLSQYGSYHVDTDEKKEACFRRGLSSKLRERLTLFKSYTYNELVSAAIELEDAIHAHEEEKKKKRVAGSSSSAAPPKYRLAITSPSGQRFQGVMPQGGGYRLPPPQHHGIPYVSHQQHAQGFCPPQHVSQGVRPNLQSCYNCCPPRHFA